MQIADLYAPLTMIKDFCVARPKTVIIVGVLVISAYLTADKISTAISCIMNASLKAADPGCVIRVPVEINGEMRYQYRPCPPCPSIWADPWSAVAIVQIKPGPSICGDPQLEVAIAQITTGVKTLVKRLFEW